MTSPCCICHKECNTGLKVGALYYQLCTSCLITHFAMVALAKEKPPAVVAHQQAEQKNTLYKS